MKARAKPGKAAERAEVTETLECRERAAMLLAQDRFVRLRPVMGPNGTDIDGRAFYELHKAVQGLQTALRGFTPSGRGVVNRAVLLGLLQSSILVPERKAAEDELDQLERFIPFVGIVAKTLGNSGVGRGPTPYANQWVWIAADEWLGTFKVQPTISKNGTGRFWKALCAFQTDQSNFPLVTPLLSADIVFKALKAWRTQRAATADRQTQTPSA